MKSPTLQPPKRPREPSYDEPSPPYPPVLDQSPPSIGVVGDVAVGDDARRAIAPAGTPIAAKMGLMVPVASGTTTASNSSSNSSNFRNVSACNRCRLRKNRCDQKLPSCESCAKARVACVGYDPITKTEIPRSYVYYLETRVETLEAILKSNRISFPPADNLELCSRPSIASASLMADSNHDGSLPHTPSGASGDRPAPRGHGCNHESHKRRRRSSGAGTASVSSGATAQPKSRSLGAVSGVAFARVVLAAVHDSVMPQSSGGSERRSASGTPLNGLDSGGASMRDSFFGLHTKPTTRSAPFPEKELGRRLANLYFEHANPQIPILHRGEFLQMFELAYSAKVQGRGARELYMLNMVFAIGCGSIVGDPVKPEPPDDSPRMSLDSSIQAQPEEYHASAIIHLEECLSSNDGLSILQEMLLLANFALLRPVPPGLWYIIGAAVRLAIDLGLYYEDGANPDNKPESGRKKGAAVNIGRRLYIRDKKRRLWWSTYALDRIVSTCVGRPFGISDLVISTEFPSALDDDYITPGGFLDPNVPNAPSYKRVSYHYFNLRLLQSEILQVLQYNQALMARERSKKNSWKELGPLPLSPFLARFSSFRDWRIDIDKRLWDWRQSAPTQEMTGVLFSLEFLELNYWQAVIMLYRQSLSVPAMFEGEYNTSIEVNSPTGYPAELREDEDRIYLKVAEAGQRTLRLYGLLNLNGLVSYTYLATHHLFMAGISYLYAIWHSPIVRSRLKTDEVELTILAAKAVFTDMVAKCPPAETCRDAFDRTARATVRMSNASGGFGPQAVPGRKPEAFSRRDSASAGPWRRHQKQASSQAGLQFDLSLSDILSSPTESPMAERSYSPRLARDEGFGTSPFMHRQQVMGTGSSKSPSDMALSHASTPLLPSPSMAVNNLPAQSQSQSQQGQGASSASSTPMSSGNVLAQAFVTTPTDYSDINPIDLFQSLQGGTPATEDVPMAALLDVDFGFNWDGFSQFSTDGQQVNLFNGFFFGGPGNGNGGAGMGGGMDTDTNMGMGMGMDIGIAEKGDGNQTSEQR